MDSFEINKIITAVLLVVLLVFGVDKISDLIFEVKKPDVEGYKVEVKVGGTTATQASSENQVDIAALLAMGDIEHGKKVYKKCRKRKYGYFHSQRWQGFHAIGQ